MKVTTKITTKITMKVTREKVLRKWVVSSSPSS